MAAEPKYLQVNIEDIILPEYNPREISQEDFKSLCRDIKTDPAFLKQRPPLLNQDKGKLICYAGFQRIKAASANGLKKIHCWIENNVPRKLQDERMIKDNMHRGQWDLAKLLKFDTELLKASGFKADDLNEMFTSLLEVHEDDFNVEEEISKIEKPVTRTGDIYLLGDHKLICGDSTDPGTIKKIFGKEKAKVIYCDPPYNIGLSYDKGIKGSSTKKRYTDKSFSDNLKPEKYSQFITTTLANALSVSQKDVHVFYWCDPKFIGLIQDAFNQCKVNNKSVCFWIKNSFNPVTNMAFNRITEPVVYGTRGRAAINNEVKTLCEIFNKEISGKNILDDLMSLLDIWIVHRDNQNAYDHPTQKPITLHEKPLKRCSAPGDLIVDLFGGSGSTMIAAEQLKRKAYLVEKDPVFCDVIVKRYEKFTGSKAKLIR